MIWNGKHLEFIKKSFNGPWIVDQKLEFGNVGFEVRDKTEYLEKTSQSKEGTNNKVNPHTASMQWCYMSKLNSG